MIDLDTLKAGDGLLIYATFVGKGGDKQVFAEVAGHRPPFSGFQVIIGEADIHSLGDRPEPPPEPLKKGDRVRNEQGVEFEVVAEPRATEDGTMLLSLWNNEVGYEVDYPENLERIA